MEVRPHRIIKRKVTKKIKVGNLSVGGDAPISVQSMTNTLTTDIEGTINQIRSLEMHIELSQETQLPLVIHMRDAEEEIIRIFKEKIKNKNFTGVIHCFTGSQNFANKMLELNFYISASGIITFKKSEELRNIFKTNIFPKNHSYYAN